ncbi:MAG: hypothetical protein JNM89_03125 [Hyphomicrobiaceae bacterium]|nr:hypothetical protein [Hyphomicrobiaceae bacterium]
MPASAADPSRGVIEARRRGETQRRHGPSLITLRASDDHVAHRTLMGRSRGSATRIAQKVLRWLDPEREAGQCSEQCSEHQPGHRRHQDENDPHSNAIAGRSGHRGLLSMIRDQFVETDYSHTGCPQAGSVQRHQFQRSDGGISVAAHNENCQPNLDLGVVAATASR